MMTKSQLFAHGYIMQNNHEHVKWWRVALIRVQIIRSNFKPENRYILDHIVLQPHKIRYQFRSGCWCFLPEHLLHRLPENQVLLPKCYMLFCKKSVIWKILAPIAPPRTPMLDPTAVFNLTRHARCNALMLFQNKKSTLWLLLYSFLYTQTEIRKVYSNFRSQSFILR